MFNYDVMFNYVIYAVLILLALSASAGFAAHLESLDLFKNKPKSLKGSWVYLAGSILGCLFAIVACFAFAKASPWVALASMAVLAFVQFWERSFELIAPLNIMLVSFWMIGVHAYLTKHPLKLIAVTTVALTITVVIVFLLNYIFAGLGDNEEVAECEEEHFTSPERQWVFVDPSNEEPTEDSSAEQSEAEKTGWVFIETDNATSGSSHK